MTFDDLVFLRVSTGITLGQEYYLNISRAEEFINQINNIIPNLFTRFNFQGIPNQFLLENPSKRNECVITSNNITYTSFIELKSDDFLNNIQAILEIFMAIFAMKDIRRIGKIYDFFYSLKAQSPPNNSPKHFLSRLIKIKEPVQVNNLQILFQREEKNINIHFLPISSGLINAQSAIEKIELQNGIVIRCDINNIQMNQSLTDIPLTFREIFGFVDEYVQSEMINFLNEYFEV